jgi:hypothetical protein
MTAIMNRLILLCLVNFVIPGFKDPDPTISLKDLNNLKT